MKWNMLALLLVFVSPALAKPDRACVVPREGYFRIHVGTSGLFHSFAHEHSIEAQGVTGCAVIDPNDVTGSSVKLEFATADIRVIDPKESEKDRMEVQKTMETEVLRISEYPRVTFESTSVERAGEVNRFRVHGNLTVRGKTLPVIIPVTLARLADGTYRASGAYSFKQSSFLIKPIQLAGGTVKVKDEVQTQFELLLK